MIAPRNEFLIGLRDAWVARAVGMGWKPKSTTYFKHQLEFLIGAQQAIEAAGLEPTHGFQFLVVLVSVGRDITEIVKD